MELIKNQTIENSSKLFLNKKEYLMLELATLELDSKIGKDRHFIASDRKNFYRISLGLFSVIGTAIIASQAIRDILSRVELESSSQTLIISIISLLVGVSTAILGFLGLERQVVQHRAVGNMYIEIARRSCTLLYQANHIDSDQKFDEIYKEFKTLSDKYIEANKEGDSCPTSKKDSEESFRKNEDNRKKIKEKVKQHKMRLLGLDSK